MYLHHMSNVRFLLLIIKKSRITISTYQDMISIPPPPAAPPKSMMYDSDLRIMKAFRNDSFECAEMECQVAI
jgi:hypothetical protein